MNLLLDTHAALWWWTEPHKLSPTAHAAITDRANTCFFSAASGYELAQKQRWLPDFMPAAFLAELPLLVEQEDWRPLPITLPHTLRAGLFHPPHRDPFDRLLAAQAAIEDLILVTYDDKFPPFGIRVLW
jgi:PIN domain nuclease of toxin-antitoxin system